MRGFGRMSPSLSTSDRTPADSETSDTAPLASRDTDVPTSGDERRVSGYLPSPSDTNPRAMDERDIRLLKAIADLGTGSPERLHEETEIPVSTIHYRLNKLRDAGIITNDLYDIDLDALGLGVTVIVEVLADYSGPYDTVGEEIMTIEGVTQVYFTMGETDFVVIAQLSSSDVVERLISDFESIEAVDRTNSTFVISTLRESHRALQQYSFDTLVDELVDSDDE